MPTVPARTSTSPAARSGTGCSTRSRVLAAFQAAARIGGYRTRTPAGRGAGWARRRDALCVGHRKNRKRERGRELQGELQWRRQPQVSEEDFLKPDPFSLLEMAGLRDPLGFRTEPAKACGGCREFVEDHEGGR